MIEQPETATAKGTVSVVEPTRGQRTVARRVAEAKATMPEVTLAVDVDVTDALAAGVALEAQVVKACAGALRAFPRANAAYRDAAFELYSRVNVGVTIFDDDALTVPTVFDADAKPAAEIAAEIAQLRSRAADGTLTSPQLAGATFTVADMGALGVTEATAILTGGQAGVLAVGAPQERPVVRDGEVVVRSVLRATLVCDHRILFGTQAAAFLGRIRELLEQPAA